MNKKLLSVMASFFMGAVLFAPVTLYASAFSGDKITIDGTYLKKAVVSDNPITLCGETRDSTGRIKFDETLVWSVTEGTDVAEITDGKITFQKAGEFKVRAAEKDDASVYAEYSGRAYDATFSNVSFDNSFKDVTVYTQPMKLSGGVEVRGISPASDCHYELKFEVVSGPAEIYLSQFLRITGKGKVVVKATSIYESDAFATAEFEVTDPDEGKIVGKNESFEQEHLVGNGGKGCKGKVGGSVAFTLCMLAACFAMTKKGNE